MLVEVRPLPEKKWHGKKGKDSFAQPKGVEVLYDVATGKYATGLTPEEANEYGKLLGVDLSDRFNPNEAHPYWSTKAAEFKLPNHTVILDTRKPGDFVKWKNMKASKKVANSLKEHEEGLWPDATHIIFDESEEVGVKASKIAMADEATLIKMKMSAQDKAHMVQILSNKTVKGRSAEFIEVEIKDIIDTQPLEFLKYAKMGREEVALRANVLEALDKNVLTKERGSVYYMGELIGMDYEAAVEWFRDPNNQKIKVSILEKLNK